MGNFSPKLGMLKSDSKVTVLRCRKTIHRIEIDPENSQFFMETNLPTPDSGPG